MALAVVVAPIALLGFAHTSAGRPLWARLDGSGAGCPIAGSAAPAALEAQRAGAMQALRGLEPAPSRPALGFALDRAGPEEVRAWAIRQGLSCEAGLAESALRCQGDVAGGAIRDVHARFDDRERLVALDVFRAGATGRVAALRFDEVRARLEADLGAPTGASGEASATYLEAGPLRRAAVAFRFRDFAADLSATNLAPEGVVLREQYRSIPDRSGG